MNEDKDKEIHRLRVLCSRAFDEINYAIGESWRCHDHAAPDLLDELLKISTEVKAEERRNAEKVRR